MWISFDQFRPTDIKLTHGSILVTNAKDEKDERGNASHVWLVDMVHFHDQDNSFEGQVLGYKGEVTAYTDFSDDIMKSIRGLSHWRPALIEEWPKSRVIESVSDTETQKLILAYNRGLMAGLSGKEATPLFNPYRYVPGAHWRQGAEEGLALREEWFDSVRLGYYVNIVRAALERLT